MKEWISVNDRLPDDDKLKVVRYADFYGGKNNGHLGIALTHFRMSYGNDSPTWDFDYSTQPTRVTHWCSVPAGEIAK